jgi:hypothetical protein
MRTVEQKNRAETVGVQLEPGGGPRKNDSGRFNVSSDPTGNVFVVAAVIVVAVVPYCVHHPIVQRPKH